MEQINDLTSNLQEKIDLSDSIDRSTKISPAKKETLNDIALGKKAIMLRKKSRFAIDVLENDIWVFSQWWKSELINLDSQKEYSFAERNREKAKVFFGSIFSSDFFKRNNSSFEKTKLSYSELGSESFAEKKYLNKKILNQVQIDKKRKNYFFPVFLFFIFTLFLWILDKILIEKFVKDGYKELQAIEKNIWNTQQIKKNIHRAQKNFKKAKILLTPFQIFWNKNIENVTHIVNGGQHISSLLDESLYISDFIQQTIKKEWWIEHVMFTSLLEDIKGNSQSIHTKLKNAYSEYSAVWDLWNPELNAKLEQTKRYINKALIYTDKIDKNYETFLSIFGHNGNRRYLILLQNNDELRATGGFIWSINLITLRNGRIVDNEKKDVYSFEYFLDKVYTNREKAPEGLNKITPTFGLRDANYYPEFQKSSEKIKFFLDKIHYDIDGIVYMNQNIVLEILEAIWWVQSQKIGKNITAENFSLIISTLVEAEVSKQGTLWTPKQVLFDFSEEFLEKIKTEKKYGAYLNILKKNIESKDIVFYSFSPVENSLLWKLWLNGKRKYKNTLDFSYPVFSQVGGNKSDRYIHYDFVKSISPIENSCNIYTQLDLNLENTFTGEKIADIELLLDRYQNLGKKREDIINIQWRINNKNYVRVLIPKNAIAVVGNGQKLIQEKEYQYLEFYTDLPMNSTGKYKIAYTLKNPSCSEYEFTLFKQPGIRNYNISFETDNWVEDFSRIEKDFIYKMKK